MTYFRGERIVVVGDGGLRDATGTALEAEGAGVVDDGVDDVVGLVVLAQQAQPGMTGVVDLLTDLDRAVTAATPAIVAAGGGAIVIVAPPMGVEREIGSMGAEAGSAALRGAVRGWALELGPLGVRVNAVRPGMLSPLDGDAGRDRGFVPLRRTEGERGTTPGDVGRAVAFLLSDDAAYLTGAELPVDGGLSQSRSSTATARWAARQGR